MNIMDTLTPQTFTVTGAKRVYLLGPEEISVPTTPKDKRIYNKLMAEKSRRLKKGLSVKLTIETLNDHLRKKQKRRLKDRVTRLKGQLALAEKALEDYLNA